MKTHRLNFCLLVLCGFALLLDCVSLFAEDEKAIRVVAAKPQKKTLVRRTEQPGQIEGFAEAALFAKLSGFVAKLHVDIGDRVTGPVEAEKGKPARAGQILAELAVPELVEELRLKQATVEAAKADVEQAAAAVKVAEAARVAAEAQASEVAAVMIRAQSDVVRYRSEYSRISNLYESQAITLKAVDEAKARLQSADAVVLEAEAKQRTAAATVAQRAAAVDAARAEQTSLAAKVKVAEADRQRVQSLLDYTTIRAPFSGRISARNVDIGHLVQPGKNASDTPLFVLVRADTVRIFADVAENDASLVVPGNEAVVRVPSLGNQQFAGKVARTAWALQPGTRTLRVEVDVPNPEEKLRPGMYVYADIKVAERNDVLALPKGAIYAQETQSFCLTVNSENKLVKTAIKIGLRAGDDVEVLEGLTGDDPVVLGNVTAYREGQLVEIVPPK